MGCGVKWQQIGELDKALGKLRRAGMGPGDPAYDALWGVRGRVFGQVGYKFPRSVISLLRLIGLSPGEVRLFFDIEAGWLTQARHGPGQPWAYHYVPDDVAITLLTGGLTHELEDRLMEPDTYLGE